MPNPVSAASEGYCTDPVTKLIVTATVKRYTVNGGGTWAEIARASGSCLNCYQWVPWGTGGCAGSNTYRNDGESNFVDYISGASGTHTDTSVQTTVGCHLPLVDPPSVA